MILPGARRALELLVQADGELLLLGEGWHELTVDRGRLQYVEGPCWVPPDRGPGRRPKAVNPIKGNDAQALMLDGWAVQPRPDRLLVTEAGRRALAATQTAEAPPG